MIFSPDGGKFILTDASGTAMAIYRNGTVTENTVYGASRLGVYNRADASTSYELTDHLGNVRAVFKSETAAVAAATDYYPFGMPMPARNVLESYRYAFQGQEKDPETGKEAFQLRLWDARIGRWLTTDPYGQYNSPYLGMGNNPINAIDSDGGYVYIVGGDRQQKQAILDVLGTRIGKERLDFLIKSPHFHVHIGLTSGISHKNDGTYNRHGAATIGGPNGIYSEEDSSLTREDIRRVHGNRNANQFFTFFEGARKDKGFNFYVGMRLTGPTRFGAAYDLFHEIDAHVYNKLFTLTLGSKNQHLSHAGTNTGRPELYFQEQSLLILPELPAYDFLRQFMFSFPSQNYRFTNPDENFNEKIECKCSN